VTRPGKAPCARIDPKAAEAHGIEGVLPIGAIIITAGVVLRVRPDGGLDRVGAGGHPHGGIASDPTAVRRAKATR